MEQNIESKFNENEELMNFLKSSDFENCTRNIIGKSILFRHCGQSMVKIREVQHYIHKDGHLELDFANRHVFYCTKCGYNINNYGD